MDSPRIRGRHPITAPTLAHIQAYERRFGPIDGPTFRELADALTVVNGGQRFQLHIFREALREYLLSKMQQAQDISGIIEKPQHSHTEVVKYYAAAQNP